MRLQAGLILVVGALLVACGGSGSTTGSDPSIVGTWGVTTSKMQGAVTSTDETYFVFAADKTVRHFSRSTQVVGNVTATVTGCGAGTYIFASGVLSMTIEEKSADPRAPTGPTVTQTVSTSSKVELVDQSLRLTRDIDGSANVVVYTQGTVPANLEPGCPR